MSVLSFKALCIEHYSAYIDKPSNEVYRLFCQRGLVELLCRDYEDLHGMGQEYLMQFFDDYLGNREVRGTQGTHALARALLLPIIIECIMEKYHMSEEQAMDAFYCSAIGEAFSDDETGLYGQSPFYTVGLFCEERTHKEGLGGINRPIAYSI